MRPKNELPLKTPRLMLRDLVWADLAALSAIHAKIEVSRYMDFNGGGLADTQRFVAGACESACAMPREAFELAVVLADGRVIGRAGLMIKRPRHREGEVWYLVDPAHWGQGYGREAVAALLDFAFGPLGLHRVIADVDPRNAASRRLLEKLGFTREGTFRENYWVSTEWCDSAMYGILEREWRSRAPA